MSKKNDAAAPAQVETRQIPNPPGGGSWTWNEARWEWDSNDPVPEPAVQPAEQPQE